MLHSCSPSRRPMIRFQSAQKFNTRYATLGFNDTANLDATPAARPRFFLVDVSDEGSHFVTDKLSMVRTYAVGLTCGRIRL